jgi:histo-blood group ABO system transferase
MKIGLTVVATNRYIHFVPPLLDSAKKFLLPDLGFDLLCFSDRPPVDGTRHFSIQHSPWPGPALFRFNTYYIHRNVLAEYDYLFSCDADMRFVAPVGREIIAESVATSHPYFHEKPRQQFTYETNPASRACVGPHEGERYFAGGFFGGSPSAFLDIARQCSQAIDEDQKKNIVAIWHDESHLNRYFCDHPPSLVLSPSYCFPENSGLPYVPKLVALDKDHALVRSSGIMSVLIRGRRLAGRVRRKAKRLLEVPAK